MRDRWWRRALPAGAGILLLGVTAAAPAGAVATKKWEVRGREDFLEATLDSLSVSSDGIVRVAPALVPVTGLEEAYVWSLAAAADGTIWAGTGNSAVLYRIRAGAAEKVTDADALQIESILQLGGRTLFGTAPDGMISAVEGTTVTKFADLAGQHVWAMARDSQGRVLAATGEPARLYRVDANGTASLLFETEADHLTALAASGSTIVCGDDRNGIIRSIDANGKGHVLFDAPEVEVRALVIMADGSVIAAVNRDIAETMGSSGGSSGKSSAGSSGSSSGGSGAGRRDTGSAPPDGPVVYRIRPDGAVETVWTAPDATIQAMIDAGDGTVLVGTGDDQKGGLYRIDPVTRDWSLLVKPGAPQLLALAKSGGEIYVGTGAPGKVLRATLDGSPTGRLLSEAHDAKQISDWGTLSFELDAASAGTITFRTRSGNTDTPDESWSDWSTPMSVATGSKITSPPARFIQWEARVGRGTALTAVDISWAEKNLPPLVRSLSVSEAGAPLGRGGDNGGPQPVVQNLPGNVRAEFSVSTQGSRQAASDEEASWSRRYRTVRWDASDPNDDELRFRIECRGTHETAWTLLEPEWTEEYYVLDTSRLPDGPWRLRVVATDAPDNSPGEERTATKESDPILVDNTPPDIEGLAVATAGDSLRVTARVSDAAGTIKSAELSLDGTKWQKLLPRDRVWDQPTEEVSVDLGRPVTPGSVLLMRAYDETGNQGVARAAVPTLAPKK